MNHFEIDATLRSFRIIADTREQRTARAAERFKAFGCPVERATLDYGDYAATVTLPDGSEALSASETVRAPCVVERKMSLDELAACFTRDRDRFRREFERAAEAGAKVYLLVEDGSYEAILHHRYRSRLHPEAYLASLLAWSVRYGFGIIFCKKQSAGRLIREILWRDMKERLSHGDDERPEGLYPGIPPASGVGMV